MANWSKALKNDIEKLKSNYKHPDNLSPQRIVCAANRFPDGTVLLGARHWDKWMRDMADRLDIKGGNEEQGFIDQHNNFITREDALIIAKRENQIFRDDCNTNDELFSEGLY